MMMMVVVVVVMMIRLSHIDPPFCQMLTNPDHQREGLHLLMKEEKPRE